MIDVTFGLEHFIVENCRSKGDHNDSDWLTLTVTNGQTTFPTQTTLIDNNLHARDQRHSQTLGPFRLDESKLTAATLAVVNLSHIQDPDEQSAKALAIQLAIDAAVIGASGVLIGAVMEGQTAKIAGAFFEIVGSAFGAVAGVVGVGLPDSNPDCNGEVFTRTLVFLPGELKGNMFVPPSGQLPMTETAKSPSECGNDPHTKVRYHIISQEVPFDHIKEIPPFF